VQCSYIDPVGPCEFCQKKGVSCGPKVFTKLSGGMRNRPKGGPCAHPSGTSRARNETLRELFNTEGMRSLEGVHEILFKDRASKSTNAPVKADR
jgi:hypothetical protein